MRSCLSEKGLILFDDSDDYKFCLDKFLFATNDACIDKLEIYKGKNINFCLATFPRSNKKQKGCPAFLNVGFLIGAILSQKNGFWYNQYLKIDCLFL